MLYFFFVFLFIRFVISSQKSETGQEDRGVCLGLGEHWIGGTEEYQLIDSMFKFKRLPVDFLVIIGRVAFKRAFKSTSEFRQKFLPAAVPHIFSLTALKDLPTLMPLEELPVWGRLWCVTGVQKMGRKWFVKFYFCFLAESLSRGQFVD